MKVIVFVSAGLGNALLQVPFLRALQKRGDPVHGIFTSPFRCEELFVDSALFKEMIVIHDSKKELLKLSTRVKEFDVAYLDYFACTRKNILLALTLAKKVKVMKKAEGLPAAIFKKLDYVEPRKNTHESSQYGRFIEQAPTVVDDDFALEIPHAEITSFSLPSTYIAVQMTAGNNTAPYKSWQKENWLTFFQTNSETNFVLLGDENEVDDECISQLNNVTSVVGKTTIGQAAQILKSSKLYVGIDSGLMHLAVACGKPTFTIWGGSDHRMFGYEQINSVRHRIIKNKLDCWPCNSWLDPNTSRVSDPNSCPDFKCIRSISPKDVQAEFEAFITSLRKIPIKGC